MENLYLGYETARWYWEHAEHAAATLDSCVYTNTLEESVTSIRVCREMVQGTPFDGMPLDVLTDKAGMNGVDGVAFHTHRGFFPEGAFVRLRPHLYIASPALSYVQVARKSSFWQVVLYGYNLCGTFARSDYSPSGVVERGQLCTPKQLILFSGKCGALPGVRMAEKCASFVREKSASPRESQAAMALTLPYRYGGKGLPDMQINARIDLPKRVKMPDGRGYVVADFLWPKEKVAVEYDSDVAHAHSLGIYRDSVKRNALNDMGYTTLCITRMQLDDIASFDAAAESIRRALGLRARRLPADAWQKELELRKELRLPTW